MNWNAITSTCLRILFLLFVLCINFDFVALTEHVLNMDYMMEGDPTHLGPEMDSVYKPGTRGGQWSSSDVDSTRLRILQMIYPVWMKKDDMGLDKIAINENKVLRLVFHDCIPYLR